MLSYGKQALISNLKYGFLEFYNKNKIRIFVIAFLIPLALLTGVFTAFKIYEAKSYIDFEDFSFVTLANGSIYTFSIFIRRFLSALLVIGLLILFSTNKYTSFLGYALLCYRAFLLSMNCSLIIIFLGLGGAINAIIIILPCQILGLLLMCLIFLLAMSAFKCKRDTGVVPDGYIKYVLIAIALTFAIGLIELMLLCIFKPTTILII